MQQSSKILRISLFLCLASFLLVIFTAYSYWKEQNRIFTEAKNNAKQEVIKAVNEIEGHLSKLQDSATNIANDLTSGTLKKDQLIDRFRKTMEENPEFSAVGSIYAPYKYNPKIRLYGPGYIKLKRLKDGIVFYQLESVVDYTEVLEYDWSNDHLVKGPFWTEPFYEEGIQSVVASFSAPFYEIDPITKKEVTIGLIHAAYFVEVIQDFMDSLELGKTGYGFLFSKKGTLLFHPNNEFVIQEKNILELPTVKTSKQLKSALEKVIKQSQASVIDYDDQLSGQNVWMFIEPFPSKEWSLAIAFIKEEVVVSPESQKQKLTIIVLGLMAFLFFLGILLLKTNKDNVKSLWLLSYYSAILLKIAIVAIWLMEINENKITQIGSGENRVRVFGKPGLNRFFNSQTQLKKSQKEPKYVPTGIFIQSLKFKGASDILVTGSIWQKYNKEVHEDISQGFTFPEAIDAEVNEIYRTQQGDSELIGWSFRATVRQEFNYSKYPFDSKQVRIKLWHKDHYKNVILTPDFDAYNLINTASQPGLDKNLFVSGWNIKGNFFEYNLHNDNTNFGIENYIGTKNYPELYFTIIMHRQFINILVNNFIVPFVVALLLFLVHLLIVEGVNVLQVFTSCTSFLFALIVNQFVLRDKILTSGIVYLEYFHFVLYIFIMVVAINAILYSQNKNISWIQYKHSLIPKLLHWPGMLGLLLMFTLLVF
ncbi:MAG: cache domain-containing protein [Crocosphaera sp.]|uniref:cache domain-containing protein n=1 Tax=Crocosphaera sp. TaxID=2729996 RepID=UPI00258B9F33|nr:cache domain-containing protein [Crocosphaera sp.]MCH2247917.1 cache domain-containing protein [Crocosphaera sp.]